MSQNPVEPYFYYWAKAKFVSNGLAFHLFPYHCLDVVAVADVWLENAAALKKTFLNAWGYSNIEVLRAWILFFVGLHDLGKLDLNFQLKAPDAAKVLLPSDFTPFLSRIKPQLAFDHGQAGYAWFVQTLQETALAVHDPDTLCHWMAAVAGHHGTLNNNDTLPRLKAPKDLLRLDYDARLNWIETLNRLFLIPAQAHNYEAPYLPEKLLAGFCSVCDWLGSNTDYFVYQDTVTEDLIGYLRDKRMLAQQALQDAGLIATPLKQGGMSLIFPAYLPQGLQKKVDTLPLQPGLTVIEAPTGSGKTEAALAYASRLLAAGQADSVIFALPTQATANAMLERLERIAPSLFPESQSNILLAHGKARFHERFKGLKKLGLGLTTQAKEEAGVYCSQWLGSSRKRVFLGQIGVCTIDQVLLSVLPVRHHFVRSFGLGKSVLIVDEIHAYDSYMNGLLDRVLKAQQRMGGSAILLSATLPSQRLQSIAANWHADVTLTNHSYPLLTHISQQAAETEQFPGPDTTPVKTVQMALNYTALARPDTELQQKIVRAAESGAIIAVICNLVDDALAVYQQIKRQTHLPVDLFHARFCLQDRMTKEMEVTGHYGKTALRQGGRILIATQVVEQSLDLDFDWMITQICPVDLLFQRLGRLHRHDRIRPEGFFTPNCTVLLPLGSGQEMPDYGLHQLIYANVRALWRTEQLLKAHTVLCFPDVYRAWIEQVYAESAWPNESTALTQAYEDYMIQQEGKAAKARNLSVSDTSPYRDTDATAALLTRDGEMALSLIPVSDQTGKRCLLKGQELDTLTEYQRDEMLSLNTIPVPSSWHKYLPPAEDGLHFLPMILHDETWMVYSAPQCQDSKSCNFNSLV
ncbi:MAG: CRISPR-associated helicase/endonuclease Cas3 [Candidatus Sericytochromatia bacterium]|nr:CRISPR-associated helicase/endonuclease Cas3 [Candidatus Sericytochromatia bacterium]